MNHELRKVFGDHPNSPMLTIEKDSGKTKRLPMGSYDKTIICSACDGTFSPWEQHALEVLFTKHAYTDLQTDRRGTPICYTLSHADYATLKLFVLSMLWKSAVSQLPFCGRVTSPPRRSSSCVRRSSLLIRGQPRSLRSVSRSSIGWIRR
jgi:hypothetical protein